MSDELIITENGERSFEDDVKEALKEMGLPSVCVYCSTETDDWSHWIGAPAVSQIPLVSGVQITTATLVCKVCGFVRTHSLNAIGLRLEESKIKTLDTSIWTPDEFGSS